MASTGRAFSKLQDVPTKSSGGPAFGLCFVTAIAAGVMVELTIGKMGNRREAWDSPSYWSIGLPLMILAALVCGFFARRRRTLLGYAPFLGQLLMMILRTGSGSMLPLGVIFMGIVGLSGVAAAFVGALLGKWALGQAQDARPPAPAD
jgi:hypothetical protein